MRPAQFDIDPAHAGVQVAVPTGKQQEHAAAASPRRPDLPIALLLVSALYLTLCAWVHSGRSWQGDEWGTYLAFRDSYQHLLTHFGGWQTMNFYIAGLKVIHDARGGANWFLVLPGMVAGVWLIWLVAALALRLGSRRDGAIIAALLIAVNPFLVTYSVTIRSYIFLAAFSSAMMLSLLSWREHGRWRDGMLCGAWGALALLAHLNAVYTYAVVVVLALCWTLGRIRSADAEPVQRLCRLMLPVLVLGGIVVSAYIPQYRDIATFRRIYYDAPPIPLTFLPAVFTRFFGEGYLPIAALGMVLYGAWQASRAHRESQWILLCILVATGSISLAGVSHFPGAYARFLVATLPWLILVIADGCAGLARRSQIVAIAIVAILCGCSVVALSARRETLHARPWQRIATYLRPDGSHGDRCVVLGKSVVTAGLNVYGISCSDNASRTLRALAPDQPWRLRLVVMPMPLSLPPSPSAQAFGDIRVLTFEGVPASIAAALAQTLISGAQDRVKPEFADVYAQIAALARWMGPPGDAQKYDVLHLRSWAVSTSVRNQPAQVWRDSSAERP